MRTARSKEQKLHRSQRQGEEEEGEQNNEGVVTAIGNGCYFGDVGVFFKVKRTTKMEKVFNTYAMRKGVNQGVFKFYLDGTRINADETPQTLDLEDQDQIICYLEQSGC